MPPRRNTRPVDNPQPLPRPGFQLLLTSLLAHREAARVASETSQPIVRWEPSSQPELLWDIIAGRTELVSAEELEAIREAVPSPPLSQEQADAVTSAAFSLPLPVVEQSILAMETVLSLSQGRDPDVTQIPVEVLNELRKIVPSPASRLPEQVARTPSFQIVRDSGSKGSSPMDISPPPPSRTAQRCSCPSLHCSGGQSGHPYHPIL
jgi:hypothetical protein